jgi:hypothetical protein
MSALAAEVQTRNMPAAKKQLRFPLPDEAMFRSPDLRSYFATAMLVTLSIAW